jgi:Ran GTPase-activating protein (RanGAP) involved in mRNA processing and transport
MDANDACFGANNYFAPLRRATQLASMLQDMSLQSLSLRRRGLADHDAQAIGEALSSNSWLQSLDLSYMSVSPSAHGFQALVESLAEALEKNNSLLCLDLSNNYLGDRLGARLLHALARNRGLLAVSMSSNQLGNLAASALACTLEANSTVRELDLSHNNFGNASGELIAGALASNAGVRSLNLSYNNFGHYAACALWQALQRNTVLETLNIAINRIGEGVAGVYGNFHHGHAMQYGGIQHMHSMQTTNTSASRMMYEAFGTNSTLKCLNLSSNRMGEEDIYAVAQGLCINSTIESLELSYNCIPETVAAHLGHALTLNNTLQKLNLCYSYLGYRGLGALLFPSCAYNDDSDAEHDMDVDRLMELQGSLVLAGEGHAQNAGHSGDRDGYNNEHRDASHALAFRGHDHVVDRDSDSDSDLDRDMASMGTTHHIDHNEHSQHDRLSRNITLRPYMSYNTCLQHLNIAFNNIGREGAHLVAHGLLKVTCGLTSLDLSSNNLGKLG